LHRKIVIKTAHIDVFDVSARGLGKWIGETLRTFLLVAGGPAYRNFLLVGEIIEPGLQPKSRPPASVSLRQQAGVHPTVSGHISPLVAAALLSKPRPLLTGWQAAKVEALKKACPDFARIRSLVMSFRGILQSGKAATLARCMKKAVASGIYGMKRFVRKLNHDLAAVKNALRESWSNGPVEGHINRLKTLKRQMYGRAGFELLRARLLPVSRGSPLHRK